MPSENDLDAQFDAVTDKFEQAKTLLESSKPNKWVWIWRCVVAAGVTVTAIFAGWGVVTLTTVQAQDTQLLNSHSNEIQTIEKDLTQLHGSTYSVVVSICEHVSGCAVPAPYVP